MHPTIIKELLALIVLITCVALFYASIPPMIYVACYVVVVLMFVIFVVSILKKTDRDEREEQHRAAAAEAGFITAGVVLLLGIAHQTLVMHKVDAWLFAALIAMLVVRLVVRLHLEKKR